MKSANTEKKVLSVAVDLGELVGLFTLYHLCKEIQNIYKPGAEVLLYTEEPFLCHMSALVEQHLGQPLYQAGQMENYQLQLRALAQHFYPTVKVMDIAGLRALYEDEYAKIHLPEINTEDIVHFMAQELSCKRLILAAQNMAFKDLSKRVCPQFAHLSYEEFSKQCMQSNDKALKKLHSNVATQLHTKQLMSTTSHALAKCAAQGAVRMRLLLSEQIPYYSSAIRLSIRPSDDVSIKLGISLVSGSKGTPWHNTILLSKEGICLTNMEKARGEMKTYTLDKLSLSYLQLS